MRWGVGGALLVGLAATIGLLSPPEASPPSRPGMEFFTVKYGAWGLARVRVLRFDPREHELRLLRPSKGETLARVSQMPGCDDALACFNGPFFDEEGGAPLGLLVSGNDVWQPLRAVTWGVFWADREGTPHVTVHDDFKSKVKPTQDVSFAIQSGPTTLLNGEVKKKDHTELARRTSIGIDDQGRVLVLIANFPVKLASLAEFAQAKLAVRSLVNLDGGSSTQLVVRGRQNEPKVLGLPVAVGVGIYPRSAPDELDGDGSRPASTK